MDKNNYREFKESIRSCKGISPTFDRAVQEFKKRGTTIRIITTPGIMGECCWDTNTLNFNIKVFNNHYDFMGVFSHEMCHLQEDRSYAPTLGDLRSTKDPYSLVDQCVATQLARELGAYTAEKQTLLEIRDKFPGAKFMKNSLPDVDVIDFINFMVSPGGMVNHAYYRKSIKEGMSRILANGCLPEYPDSMVMM